jgi:hypothetical protein
VDHAGRICGQNTNWNFPCSGSNSTAMCKPNYFFEFAFMAALHPSSVALYPRTGHSGVTTRTQLSYSHPFTSYFPSKFLPTSWVGCRLCKASCEPSLFCRLGNGQGISLAWTVVCLVFNINYVLEMGSTFVFK